MNHGVRNRDRLEALCRKFRREALIAVHAVQSGHPGGSLSVCEILTSLYFEKANVDGNNPGMPDRDRIVLCKGHAAPILYVILAELGFFPVEYLKTLRRIDGRLQGHPSIELPGVELPTGPLGAGFGAAQGMALGLRLSGIDSYVYAILGDGECNEGAIWETAMSAAKYKLSKLIAIIDYNKVQLDGTTEEVMPLGDFAAKWRAFGWNTAECDGHDLDALADAIDAAKTEKERPSVIIAHTVKGKGVSFMEGKSAYHGKAVENEELRLALIELGGEA